MSDPQPEITFDSPVVLLDVAPDGSAIAAVQRLQTGATHEVADLLVIDIVNSGSSAAMLQVRTRQLTRGDGRWSSLARFVPSHAAAAAAAAGHADHKARVAARRLITSGVSGPLCCWDVDAQETVWAVADDEAHRHAVVNPQRSEHLLVTAEFVVTWLPERACFSVWATATGRHLRTIAKPDRESGVARFRLSRVRTSDDTVIGVLAPVLWWWSLSTGEMLRRVELQLLQPSLCITSHSLSPDGLTLVVKQALCRSYRLALCSTVDGRMLGEMQTTSFVQVHFAPVGSDRCLLLAGSRGTGACGCAP